MKDLDKEFDKKFLERPYEGGIIYADRDEVKTFIRKREKELLDNVVGLIDQLDADWTYPHNPRGFDNWKDKKDFVNALMRVILKFKGTIK